MMDALRFQPAPYAGATERVDKECGCRACASDGHNARAAELDASEDERAFQWEVARARTSCRSGTPPEVEGCRRLEADDPIQCRPGFTEKCPAIPEVWTSRTIAGVPFRYAGHPVIQMIGARAELVSLGKSANRNYAVQLAPDAWRATASWITSMAAFGMPITSVITAGAARYCRCVRQPKGVCKESDRDNWNKCTGTTISDHGYADALDIIGVTWADKAAVGSSTTATLIHSWKDAAEQAPLLIRINAALRQAFTTVIDYADPGHRNHFHCDMNHGLRRNPFHSMERPFVIESLFQMGYLAKRLPIEWPRARDGLVAFARRKNLTVPSTEGPDAAWRPLLSELFRCVAMAGPAGCRP
ncbi:MAG: extensin family protein [Myxococcales bacterium]|nr:extensin family protein [Myxococcales bacterium]